MTRRQTAGVAVVLVGGTVLSALVAYRAGLRRGLSRTQLAAGASEAGLGAGSGDCVDFRLAGAHTGEQTCVSGRVLKVFSARSGNTFLDFCADFRNCPFTSVVFASDRSKFGNLSALGGRRIEIHGKIVPYHGQPEIIVSDPSQFREAP